MSTQIQSRPRVTAISLTVAILSAGLAILLGASLGGIAGYVGGWPDALIMRFTDGMLSIPIFFLVLVVLECHVRRARAADRHLAHELEPQNGMAHDLFELDGAQLARNRLPIDIPNGQKEHQHRRAAP